MTMNVTARHHHPMSDRLDPAPYAEQARQLRALASRARAAYEEKLVDDGARLGLERDKAARAKSAAEQELAAAKLQSKRELGVADQADKAAAALERRATQTKGTAGEELREQAAEQRARAEIARRRAHAADDDAESLQFTVGRHHQTVELLETQMKSNDDMKRVEREIDHLETHADVAEGTARAALRADELQQRLSDAAARGDKVLVKQLSTEIDRGLGDRPRASPAAGDVPRSAGGHGRAHGDRHRCAARGAPGARLHAASAPERRRPDLDE